MPQYEKLLAEAEPKLAALESARQNPKQASPVQPAVGVYDAPRQYQPGDEFRDCEECPLMVVVPAGSFIRGPADYLDRTPQHHVTFAKSYAIGKYEVTFAQWDACVRAGGCSHNPEDEGRGRGQYPVMNVSWQDAQQYASWLSTKTGADYRLPSEAEWEYVARAGSTEKHWWGDKITENNGNFSWYVGRTTEVGTYPANSWGLHDTAGNVSEYVLDCWHESYKGAPSDGSAWLKEGRVITEHACPPLVRGGSWFDDNVTSEQRERTERDNREPRHGFRVVRTLQR